MFIVYVYCYLLMFFVGVDVSYQGLSVWYFDLMLRFENIVYEYRSL